MNPNQTPTPTPTPYQFPMERVLYNLHHKCGVFALNNTSPLSRSRAEQFVLIAGFCSLGALVLVHSTFVYSTGLRATCLPHFVKDADLVHVRLTNEPMSRVVMWPNAVGGMSDVGDNESTPDWIRSTKAASSLDLEYKEPECRVSNQTTDSANETTTGPFFSFAREKAYLYFSDELVQRHGIRVQTVYVSKSNQDCFGDSFVQFLVYLLNGYDTVMINWLIGTYTSNAVGPTDDPNLHRHHTGEGYIYNQHTREPPTDIRSGSYQLFSNEMSLLDGLGGRSKNTASGSSLLYWLWEQLLIKGSVVIKTSFLFFITTKLVAFTLRETQSRMLEFTHHLGDYFRYNRSIIECIHLATTHVVENLVFVPVMVGMVFFLINFYRGDMFIAFFVLSLVWVCESLSLVGLRTEKAIHYFPLFFFPFFAIFHYYYIAVPWGFHYAALFTSMCFILHSMLFFWHRYELPAVHMAITSANGGGPHQEQPLQRQQEQPHPHPQQPVYRATPDMTHPLAPTNAHPNTHTFRRNQSFNTTTSGVLSRTSSHHGMYQLGNERDDDDASSTRYGVGSEFVVSRTAPVSVPMMNDRTHTSPTLLPEQRRPVWSGRERYVSDLEPLVASAVSADEDSVQLARSPRSAQPSPEPGTVTGHDAAQTNYGETSALHAIYNVMNEDDSMATSRRDRTDSVSELSTAPGTIFR